MNITIAPDFEHLPGLRPLTDEEFSQLEQNVLADPKHERMPPVVIWQCGKTWTLIEGHHQHKLRLRHGLKVKYAKMEFADRMMAQRYAYEAQFGRRNLSPSERAAAAAEYAKLLQICSASDAVKTRVSKRDAIREAAEKGDVSERTVWDADKVNEHASKPVQDAVKAGDVSVSDAASVADLPKGEQTAALKKVKSGKAKTLKAAAKPKGGGLAEAPSKDEQAKKNKTLANSYRDKLARAICDYHQVKPNKTQCDRLVKIVQGIELW